MGIRVSKLNSPIYTEILVLLIPCTNLASQICAKDNFRAESSARGKFSARTNFRAGQFRARPRHDGEQEEDQTTLPLHECLKRPPDQPTATPQDPCPPGRTKRRPVGRAVFAIRSATHCCPSVEAALPWKSAVTMSRRNQIGWTAGSGSSR